MLIKMIHRLTILIINFLKNRLDGNLNPKPIKNIINNFKLINLSTTQYNTRISFTYII